MSGDAHTGGPVRVVISFDSDYLAGAAVLLHSLRRFVPELEVCALHPGIPADQLAFLRRLFGGMQLDFVPVTLRGDLRRIQWLSPTTSARMLIPELLGWPRCLYVDCDVLCLADLTPIYHIDLEGFPIAAVRDDYDVADPMKVFADYWAVPPDQIPDTGFPPLPLTKLFAPGFMVMDCDAWRSRRFADRYFEWLTAHQRHLRLPNVCGANVVASGQFLELSWRVNANILCHGPGGGDLDPGGLLSVHFAGPRKPWNSESSEWPDLWELWRSEFAGVCLEARRCGLSGSEVASFFAKDNMPCAAS